MDFNKKSETREFKPTPLRSEVPPNYFIMPCRDIAQVQLSTSGTQYLMRDSKGKELPPMHKGIYGELQGHINETLVFKKGSIYQICDSRGRNSVKQESLLCGEFRSVSGPHFVFEKDNMLQTYDKNFKKVGHPQRRI